MTKPIIREVTSDLITFSVPFSRGGLPFGGRSTAVKLSTGDVFLAASHPLTDETRATIDKLGPVKYIAALDAEHTMSTKQYTDAYPQARLIGPKAAADSKKDLPWAGVFGRDAEPLGPELTASKEIEAAYFSGHANADIAFFHAPSRTLIEADLLFNLPAKEQYRNNPSAATPIWPISIFNNGLNPKGRSHQFLISVVSKDKANVAEGAKKVAAWDFDRIIPCHGDVIETGGKEAWREVFKRFL